MVLPVVLWCLNVGLNFLMKSGKVPLEMFPPEMALCKKVVAQVRADPLVI